MAIQLSGSLAMSGSIIATGEIIAQMLNVQQVTSSVIYSSGSNIFGNSLSNTQQFTGSVLVTGSLTVSGPISGTGPTQGTIVYGSTVVCSPSILSSGTICSTSNTCFGGNTIIAGCLGIGTNTPSDKLEVNGAILSTANTILTTTKGAIFDFNDGQDAGRMLAYKSTGANLLFYTNASGSSLTERLRITSTGVSCFSNTVCAPTVQINTSINCGRLNITGYDNDSINIIDQRSSGTGCYYSSLTFRDYYLGESGAIRFYHNQGIGSSINSLRFIINASEKLLLTNGGVGCFAGAVCAPVAIISCISVGTTCTLGRLTVASEAGTSGITLLNTTAATVGTETQFITWEGLTNGSALHACPLGRIGVVNVNGGTSIGSMVFYTKQYNAGICERMRITSDGYVGIGVTSPSLILHTSADGAAGQIMADQYGAVGSNILLRSARGTSASPTATQAGDLLGSIGSRGYDGSAFSGGGRAGVYMYAGENFTSTNQGTFLIIGTTALGAASRTERIRVTTEGNVGIGNTSPLTKLTVNNAIAGAILPYVQGTGLSYNNEGISVAGSNTNNTNIGNGLTLYNNVASVGAYGPVVAWSSMTPNGAYNSTYAFVTGVYGGAGGDNNWAIGDLILGTAESYGATERMRIRNNGNVGIGTTNPNVYGNGFTNQFTVSTTSGYANISVAGSSGNSGGIDFGNQSVRHAGVYGLNGSDLGFYTNGSNSGNGLSERMRITSGGNVGIGTTSLSTEANLFLGAQGTNEGGQLVLQKGTSCSCATHLDNYQDTFRILSGTNTGTTTVNMAIDHKTGFVCATRFIGNSSLQVGGYAFQFTAAKNFNENTTDVEFFKIAMGGGQAAIFVNFSSHNSGTAAYKMQTYHGILSNNWTGWMGCGIEVTGNPSCRANFAASSINSVATYSGCLVFRVSTTNNGTSTQATGTANILVVTDGTVPTFTQL